MLLFKPQWCYKYFGHSVRQQFCESVKFYAVYKVSPSLKEVDYSLAINLPSIKKVLIQEYGNDPPVGILSRLLKAIEA